MKTSSLRARYVLVFLPLVLLASVSFAALATTAAAISSTSGSASSENVDQMTQEELQAAVLSYARRYIAVIGQAATQLEEAIPTDQARLNAARRKVYSISAVVETAAGPNPGSALLDLVVNVTLSRMVWEDYWRPKVFGKPGTIMVAAYKKMEADAWELAAKVMTSKQLLEFQELISDWYAANPEQVFVDYITFSDFGDLGKKPGLKSIQKPGGLLAPVREAAEAVDDVRMTVERAMFLLTKMQLIMGSQVELVYRNLVMQTEMKTLLTDISEVKETADRYAVLLEELPRHVSRERQALLEAIDDKAATIHTLNTDILATLEQTEGMLKGMQQTITDANTLITTTDSLLARIEPYVSNHTVTAADYINAINTLQEIVSGSNQLVLAADKTGVPFIAEVLNQFNRAADERVDHIFWRILVLIAAIGGIVLILVVVHGRLKRKST